MDEKAAFEKNYKNNKSFITSVLRHYIKDPATVEDLAQQTFTNAWVARHSFEGRSAYRTWLYRIAVNVTFTHLVKERHRAKTFVNNLDMFESDAKSLHYLYITPLHSVIAGVNLETLWKKIQELPQKPQEALVLYAIYGMPYHEIANTLGVPTGTIKSRINRARAFLIKRLGHMLEE